MHEFHLPDMTCGHCVAAVTKAVHELDPLATLEFDREARVVRVGSGLDREQLIQALDAAGYTPRQA